MTTKKPKKPRPPRQATSILTTCCRCGCGDVIVEMFDGRGRPYAQARMTRETALGFVIDVLDGIENPVPERRALTS